MEQNSFWGKTMDIKKRFETGEHGNSFSRLPLMHLTVGSYVWKSDPLCNSQPWKLASFTPTALRHMVLYSSAVNFHCLWIWWSCLTLFSFWALETHWLEDIAPTRHHHPLCLSHITKTEARMCNLLVPNVSIYLLPDLSFLFLI